MTRPRGRCVGVTVLPLPGEIVSEKGHTEVWRDRRSKCLCVDSRCDSGPRSREGPSRVTRWPGSESGSVTNCGHRERGKEHLKKKAQDLEEQLLKSPFGFSGAQQSRRRRLATRSSPCDHRRKAPQVQQARKQGQGAPQGHPICCVKVLEAGGQLWGSETLEGRGRRESTLPVCHESPPSTARSPLPGHMAARPGQPVTAFR